MKESSSRFWEFKFAYWKNQAHIFKNSSLNILIIVTFLNPCMRWRAWRAENIVTSTTVPRSEGDAEETCEETLAERMVYSSLLVLSTYISESYYRN